MKIFVHTIEIFDCDLLVGVGCKGKDFKKFIEKNGTKEAKSFFTDEDVKSADKTMEGNKGFCFRKFYNDKNWYVIWLKKWDDKWDDYETLIHELNHLKQYHWEAKVIKDEQEFESYFLESCFRELRKRIYKEVVKKKK